MSAPLDSARAIRPGEELDIGRLEAYLAAHLPETSGTLAIEQFPGGFSNLTYLLRIGERELVLRRPPFGANIKNAHDMGREYRLLQALRPSYGKVPNPLLYCQDEHIIGAPFYVMERVWGVILRARPPRDMTLSPELMRGLSDATVDALADLHLFDYQSAGLGDIGRPIDYVERQVRGWATRYVNARTDEVAGMERAARWLDDHIPADQSGTGAALIHNDFKYDNLVLDPTNLVHIRAVLDWEMATIGEPLFDLGTTLAYWTEANDAPALQQFGLTHLPGNLSREQVVERYAARTGRDVGNINYAYVFGLFKVGVILQQIYARYRRGHTQDERFAALIGLVRLIGEQAVGAIERRRIGA